MEGYIDKFFLKYGHTKLMHPQIDPHKHREIKYGAMQKLRPAKDTGPDLESAGVKIIQAIIGALLYYERAIESKLLVEIIAIGDQ